jgi:hypothetical protein
MSDQTFEIFFSICVGVYTAPEIYRNEPFDRSVDVFAFGLILYEVHKSIQSYMQGIQVIICCI